MKEKKLYVTADGTEYENKKDAIAHENVVFIKSKGFTEALIDYHVKAQESVLIKQKVRVLGSNWRQWQTGYINAMLDVIERLEQNKFRGKDLDIEEAKEILRWKNIKEDGLPKERGYYQVYAKFDYVKVPEIYRAFFEEQVYSARPYPTWSVSDGWEKESTTISATNPPNWCNITHWRKVPTDIPSDIGE